MMRTPYILSLLLLVGMGTCFAVDDAYVAGQSLLNEPEERIELSHKSYQAATEAGTPSIIEKLFKDGQQSIEYDRGGPSRFKDHGKKVLAALYGLGGTKEEMYGALGAASIKGTTPPRNWGKKVPTELVPAHLIFEAERLVSSDDKVAPLAVAEIPNLLEKRARAAYFYMNPWYKRLFTLPTLAGGIAAGAFGGMALAGNHFLSKVNHQLSWVALERHVLRQRLLEEFGHANKKDLALLAQDPASNLSPISQKLIERYAVVDARYSKLNWQWTAAMTALIGGSIGSIANLWLHINRNPVSKWQKELSEQRAP